MGAIANTIKKVVHRIKMPKGVEYKLEDRWRSAGKPNGQWHKNKQGGYDFYDEDGVKRFGLAAKQVRWEHTKRYAVGAGGLATAYSALTNAGKKKTPTPMKPRDHQ